MNLKLHFVEKVIVIVCLLMAVVAIGGYSFAYFTAGVRVESDGGAKVNANTADLIKVEYDSGISKLSLLDAYPGISSSKNFTVKVTPTSYQTTATYNIKLVINNNTFKVCADDNNTYSETNKCIKNAQELVVTLIDNEGNSHTKDITTSLANDEILLFTDTKKPTSATLYNYSLKVEFKNTNADQNHNVNKILDAELKVEF